MNIEIKKAINFIKNKPTIRMIQKKDSEENWDRSTMKPLDGEIIIYSKDEKHNYPRRILTRNIRTYIKIKQTNSTSVKREKVSITFNVP